MKNMRIISIITGAYIHIFVFTYFENNRFSKAFNNAEHEHMNITPLPYYRSFSTTAEQPIKMVTASFATISDFYC